MSEGCSENCSEDFFACRKLVFIICSNFFAWFYFVLGCVWSCWVALCCVRLCLIIFACLALFDLVFLCHICCCFMLF